MLPFYCAHPRTAAKVTNDRSVAIGLDALATNQGVVAIGDDAEGTVDASHPTDLGFMRQADAFEPVLRAVLQADRPRATSGAK